MLHRAAVICTLQCLYGLLFAQGSRLGNQVNGADSIVVANAASNPASPDGATLYLTVRNVLKGSAVFRGEQLLVALPATGLARFRGGPVCGTFFLQRSGSAWNLVAQAEPNAFFESFYFPSQSCSAPPATRATPSVPGASALDTVLEEIAASVNGGAGPDTIQRLFHSISPAQSAQVASMSLQFSQSTNAQVKLLGLAWRVGESDSSALQVVAGSLPSLAMPPLLDLLVSSIAAYSNADPSGIQALGTIAGKYPHLVVAVSEALRNIHTQATLPYALRILGNPDQRAVEDAVATMSLYALRAPLFNDKNRAAAFDAAVNPTTRIPLDPDVAANIHFGPFQNPASQAQLVQWWTGWCNRMGVY